ncbi:PEPxxWA-CTERM sorting domain-containing protein [Phenylobacterium sp.]|uniref:PEPxxWA-CTERM sorting domain-containing protein n=1 Tax=Phenylobacterium sp. TaxID=1871053 RepID=UPI002C8AECB6|nr:PEPxxWA-CTERM sorting domain-containing protein [Phenylobacterium sp.]HLZ77293.1 PEPxxWA-CTERM sorting domain-containing protein [Phenylobacterium sp.]
MFLACVALAQPAAAQAHGGIRIDNLDPATGGTATARDAVVCTFGQACDTPETLSYSYTLPDGTSSNQLYVYAQGVIGLGSAVHVVDGQIVSPGYYLAPGLDLSLNAFVQEQTMHTPESIGFNFYVGDPGTGGVFQVLFTDGRDPLIGEQEMLIHFGAGDDTSGQDPRGSFPGLGISPTAFIGSTGIVDLSTGLGALAICGDGVGADCGDAPAFDDGAGPYSSGGGVPEPATWAMLLSGFALLGGALRRRRGALA